MFNNNKIIKKNRAKKFFLASFCLLFLFLFITPSLADFECSYTTSTGDIICSSVILENIQTFFDWQVTLFAFLLVLVIILIFLNIR